MGILIAITQAQKVSTGALIAIILLAIIVSIAFGFLAKYEAMKQGRREVIWFVLGIIFLLDAFFALKVSSLAKEKGHNKTLWAILGVAFGVIAILALETALNAENKQHDFDCWAIIGFVFSIIALLISCFLKPLEIKYEENANTAVVNPEWLCENCGAKNEGNKTLCRICSMNKPKK